MVGSDTLHVLPSWKARCHWRSFWQRCWQHSYLDLKRSEFELM
jgi:hypothetical protein